MECNDYTEEDWITFLKDALVNIGQDNITVTTVQRQYNGGSYYSATLMIRTTTLNTTMVREILKLSLATDGVLQFLGSQIAINDSLTSDYISVIAKINI
jgi:hypothetical protein